MSSDSLVFVDASVFLYMSDPREPAKQPRAQEWVRRLWQDRRGRTSMQVLSEYYAAATLTRAPLSPQDAWAHVQELLAWPTQPTDRSLLARGREVQQRYELDWWDATIVAAAQLLDCRILLSEALPDREDYGTVRVLNPFLHAVTEPLAEYTVVQTAAPLHRGRGRPRKSAIA